MKAILYDRYGRADVLRLADVAEPEVGRGDVLVRVTRAALNPKDALTRSGRFRRLSGNRFPKRCGMDLAGVVLESRSPRFSPGQRVFGFIAEVRYLRGSLAERVACRPHELAVIPDGVSDEAAAASALGAEVHTVSSEANVPLCRELGAHHAWSYPEHGWKREPPFDAVFDVFGNLVFRDVRAHLGPRGRYVSTVPSVSRQDRDRDRVTGASGGTPRVVEMHHYDESRGREMRAHIFGRYVSTTVKPAPGCFSVTSTSIDVMRP